MPRYFFDIYDEEAHRDDDGQICGDAEEARRLAVQSLPGLAQDAATASLDTHSLTLVVRDEAGQPIYSSTLRYAGSWLKARNGP